MEGLLHTKNGTKKIESDVANYINSLLNELSDVKKERNDLKIRVFQLETKASRNRLYRFLFD